MDKNDSEECIDNEEEEENIDGEEEEMIERYLMDVVSMPLELCRKNGGYLDQWLMDMRERWVVRAYKRIMDVAKKSGMRFDAMMVIRYSFQIQFRINSVLFPTNRTFHINLTPGTTLLRIGGERLLFFHPKRVVEHWDVWQTQIREIWKLLYSGNGYPVQPFFMTDWLSRCKSFNDQEMAIIWELTKDLWLHAMSGEAQRYALRFKSDFLLRKLLEAGVYAPQKNTQWSLFSGVGNVMAVNLLVVEEKRDINITNDQGDGYMSQCTSRHVVHRLLELGYNPKALFVPHPKKGPPPPYVLFWICEYDASWVSHLSMEFLFAGQNDMLLYAWLCRRFGVKGCVSTIAAQKVSAAAALLSYGYHVQLSANQEKALNPYMVVWSKQTHRFCSVEIRQQVKTSLLVFRRVCGSWMNADIRGIILGLAFQENNPIGSWVENNIY